MALWHDLSPWMQDMTILLAWLSLPGMVMVFLLRGFAVGGFVLSVFWGFRWTNLVFMLLIAVAVGLGVGLTAQERGLRQGTAKAAEKFTLVVAAPGSETTMMLAAVYLQPSDVPLLDGEIYHEIASHEHVAFAAPLAFGDSYQDAPIVGSTADFVAHLSDGRIDGRVFARSQEAIVGAATTLQIGERFTPAHGAGNMAEDDAHVGFSYEVVGVMERTGSPWDRAIIVPVEGVWGVHGLGTGHPLKDGDRIGPPFDAELFPGTPAILVHAEQLWANYALKSEFTRDDVMAFFPGTILAELYQLMGDVRSVISIVVLVSQILVASAVLVGLTMMVRLFARRLSLLMVLGAPGRFVYAVVWSYASLLVLVGSLLGLLLGFGATLVISMLVTQQTNILVEASLHWPELHLVASFFAAMSFAALILAFFARNHVSIERLRT